MPQTSPGVGRVVAILNFMAEHPEQSFTLTDIVRALRLSRATCHALLAGLVEARYLYRTTDKSYGLGPSLAAIGRIADEHFSLLRAAQPEMRLLADMFDAICSAVFREGDHIVVRERSASRSHLGWSVPRGTRLPLRPPTGTIFTTWSPRVEAEAFIAAAMPDAPESYRAELFDGIDFTRRMGFQTALRARENQPAADVTSVNWLLDYPAINPPIRVATALETGQDYSLTSLTAPVFDEKGRIEFVLGLMGFVGNYSGAAIIHMGRQLRAACDRVTGLPAAENDG